MTVERVAIIAITLSLTLTVRAKVDFARDVQPVLSRHCLKCHGGVRKKAGLSFINRAAALTQTKSDLFAIVPGKPAESELLNRVTTADPDDRMPPSGDPLTPAQIARIRQWIREGAPWPEHWAYRPIQHPLAPAVRQSAWVRNPIDRFVLAELERRHIRPSPPADRYTLIRRLYLDLLGLIPTPQEADAFVHDASSDADTKLVDRLLASPHFGERWGRHWLDQARYADSDGYEKDNARPDAWRWRDWVIRAFNQDLPFDQFTVQQLAGDLMPNATVEQQLATAFHRQTLFNREGGVDPEEDRTKRVIDRVNTTATVWLGLTVGCAQCHDHPYDAIRQQEFYRLYAFFNNADEVTRKVPKQPGPVRDPELDRLKVELAAAEEQVGVRQAQWEQRVQAESARAQVAPVQFHPLEIAEVRSQNGAEFEKREDGSWFVTGKNPAEDKYTITARTDQPEITGLRLEVLADDQLPAHGPGRVNHGNFVLNEVRLYAHATRELKGEHRVALQGAVADFAQAKWPAAAVVDGDEKTGWAISPQMGRDHWLVCRTAHPLATARRSWLQIVLSQRYGHQHTLGRFRVLARTGTDIRADLPESVLAILQTARAKRTAQQNARLADYYATQVDARTRELRQQIQRRETDPSRFVNARVLAQRREHPRTTYVFHRGDFLQPEKATGPLQPGTPAVLPPLQPRGPSPDRLDLARWLVSPANPLTGRVRVNSIWAHLFGAGLVATPDDFGTRGERPSHADLLDWLATRYRELGWHRKALIRLIVTSATYRQSCAHRPGLAEVDPGNRWWHRQNRWRIEAEIVRDAHLAASGLLRLRIGGPSVYPPIPPDVAALSYANSFKWTASTGDDRYRRGMYTFFKRTAPDPNLMMFDCPDANVTRTVRNRSNTPIQALATLQNEVYVEAAQAMGQRLLELNLATDQERLAAAFRLGVTRPPTALELDHLQQLLQANRDYYSGQSAEAKKLVGPYRAAGWPVEIAAAWVATARIILNLDEFITRN